MVCFRHAYLPNGSDGEESACNAGELGSSLGQEEDPLEEGVTAHSEFLPRISHGQRSLPGCSPWGRRESDMTK